MSGYCVGHVRDRVDADRSLRRELSLGAVVVEAHHRAEALARHIRGVRHRDQRVGVGRVADHENMQIAGRVGVERLPLGLEDAAIGLQQVGALHPGTARASANQQGDVDAIEGDVWIVADVDARKQREGAVGQLHRRPLGGGERRRYLQQTERHRRVGAEHRPARDAKQDRVADLAGGAGDGDFDGIRAHQSFSSSITASANSAVPTAVGSPRSSLRSKVTLSPLRITVAIARSSRSPASTSPI